MTEVNIAPATSEPSWVRWWKPPVVPNRLEAYFALMSFVLMPLDHLPKPLINFASCCRITSFSVQIETGVSNMVKELRSYLIYWE